MRHAFSAEYSQTSINTLRSALMFLYLNARLPAVLFPLLNLALCDLDVLHLLRELLDVVGLRGVGLLPGRLPLGRSVELGPDGVGDGHEGLGNGRFEALGTDLGAAG